MELKNILLLDKNKKVYYTHYEVGDILRHEAEISAHYLVEDIRGVYSLRVLENNDIFSWDVEIVDKARKIKRVA